MTFNGVSPLWDFSLPPALPEISDDQFLTLLNRQFESTKGPESFQSSFNSNPTADPQALTRFPGQQPQPLSLSPLVSEDSSPSPPGSSTDQHGTRSRKQSVRSSQRNARSNTNNSEDHLKRKASRDDDDDDDDEDGHRDKSFHADDDGRGKKSGTRRKSAGGNQQKSEDRLLKRKEQNRAAQRAFRERKEKHVRDLEEKVAMLEAKSDIQSAENENLRDLLGRLQSENLALKQSRFTFSVNNADKADGTRNPKSPPVPSSSTSGPTSPPTGSTEGYDTSMAYFSPTFFNSAPLPGVSNQPDLSAYGVGPPYNLPTQSPYTTIAANPLYMSFSDSPSFSSYLSPSDSSGSARTPGSTKNSAATTSNTTPDIIMSPRSMQELFGAQFDGLMPMPSNFNVFSPNPGNSNVHTQGSMSPVAHGGDQEHSDCPKSKEDVAMLISNNTPTTLGPPPSGNGVAVDFVTPHESDDMTGVNCDPNNKAELPCHVFPAIPESTRNVTLNDAWERVSKHPQFSECDMDELCALLTAQAKCDGSKPVLEPSSIATVMDKIPEMAQANRK